MFSFIRFVVVIEALQSSETLTKILSVCNPHGTWYLTLCHSLELLNSNFYLFFENLICLYNVSLSLQPTHSSLRLPSAPPPTFTFYFFLSLSFIIHNVLSPLSAGLWV